MIVLLAVGLGLLLGLGGLWVRCGPRPAASPEVVKRLPLPEAAVLRDGTLGHTRWAFAAVLLQLARDGHCTLRIRTQRRWLRPMPVVTIEPHADLPALSPFEQTVLRQLLRHDSVDGFGFAGSTFRRRTLRAVRGTLVARGWVADRRRASTLLWGGAVLGVGAAGLLAGTGVGPRWAPAVLAGLGMAGTLAALPRFPQTKAGAAALAGHETAVQAQRDHITDTASSQPTSAARRLRAALPALVLTRQARPRWLHLVATSLDSASDAPSPPSWVQHNGEPPATWAEAVQHIGTVLRAMGAVPLRNRL